MGQVLTDAGEEYVIKNGLDGLTTAVVGLYLDSTDAVTDTDIDPSTDITTEPGGAGYSRQTVEFSAADIGGNWGVDNDNAESFDLSDSTTGSIDGYFVAINFNSTEGGSTADWVLWTGALSQTYTLSNVDTLNIAAGDGAGAGIGITLD